MTLAVRAPHLISLVIILINAGGGCCVARRSAQESGQWVQGHATYFGASDAIADAYDKKRGKGSFGQLSYASCGYTEEPQGVMPFPRDAVGALADTNPDYAGGCGRCYEVRCRSGIVYVSPGVPVRIKGSVAIIGDEEQPSFADINDKIKDSQGRLWPGNPYAAQNVSGVTCWSDDTTIRIRIIDSCPCNQKLPSGKVRKQTWCCGGMPHIDMSYWAFEKLAHPIFGAMPIEFRPVDCHSGAPVTYSPPYVSKQIYGDAIEAGWGWHPYHSHSSTMRVAGNAPHGASATCVHVSPHGGLSFLCRQGGTPGLQPFKGADGISFWIRSDSDSDSIYSSSTPKGKVPDLKVFLMADETTQYCKEEIYLTDEDPEERDGGWYRFYLPITAFGCDGGYAPVNLLDRLDFQVPSAADRDAYFCLADLKIQ